VECNDTAACSFLRAMRRRQHATPPTTTLRLRDVETHPCDAVRPTFPSLPLAGAVAHSPLSLRTASSVPPPPHDRSDKTHRPLRTNPPDDLLTTPPLPSLVDVSNSSRRPHPPACFKLSTTNKIGQATCVRPRQCLIDPNSRPLVAQNLAPKNMLHLGSFGALGTPCPSLRTLAPALEMTSRTAAVRAPSEALASSGGADATPRRKLSDGEGFFVAGTVLASADEEHTALALQRAHHSPPLFDAPSRGVFQSNAAIARAKARFVPSGFQDPLLRVSSQRPFQPTSITPKDVLGDVVAPFQRFPAIRIEQNQLRRVGGRREAVSVRDGTSFREGARGEVADAPHAVSEVSGAINHIEMEAMNEVWTLPRK
jgi:hypothetical protein